MPDSCRLWKSCWPRRNRHEGLLMRLFVALDLPWHLRQRVAALVGGGIPGARWVPPENYHMTLRFIGEAPAHRAEEIDLALAGLRARGFSLTLAGLGAALPFVTALARRSAGE